MGGARPSNRHLGAKTGAVFAEILDELRALEQKLVAHPEIGADEQSVCEAYRWLFSITQVALDCFVWGDVDAPRFVDIVGASKKWGGDNADAYYQHAPIGPGRRYRVVGNRGDAVYLSLTVYAGPADGRYSERIVDTINDRDLTFDDDGGFSFWISPEPVDSGPGIVTDPESVVALTRDYLPDPVTMRRTSWRIEALDPAPPYRLSDDDLARRMTCALTWIRDQAALVPVGTFGAPNDIEPPYPVPTATFGWAAGDAAYAMGRSTLPTTKPWWFEAGRRAVHSGTCAFGTHCFTPTTTTAAGSRSTAIRLCTSRTARGRWSSPGETLGIPTGWTLKVTAPAGSGFGGSFPNRLLLRWSAALCRWPMSRGLPQTPKSAGPPVDQASRVSRESADEPRRELSRPRSRRRLRRAGVRPRGGSDDRGGETTRRPDAARRRCHL